jgi:glycine dehydrogenase subunit 2
MPVPRVEFDGRKYYLDYNCPQSIGKTRSFLGNFGVILKSYMWIMQHGAEGLKEAAICSVLNNNYMMKKLKETRVSLCTTISVSAKTVWNRSAGVGKNCSRIPALEPECQPKTVRLRYSALLDFTSSLGGTRTVHSEPCESYSKDDLDEYCVSWLRSPENVMKNRKLSRARLIVVRPTG